MKNLKTVLIIALSAIGIFTLGTYLFMVLWNILATYFGIKLITFKIAFVMICLIGCISGSKINLK